jgi:nitroreductase
MELDKLAKLIQSRRSIRRWQNKKVPPEMLLKAVELATWAPNGGNQQNWRFYIITSQQKIEAIADAVQASTDKIASWPEAASYGASVTDWQKRASFFRSAPAAFAVTASRYQSQTDLILAAREGVDPGAGLMRQWRNTSDSRIQSVAAATAYLALALHQMGLGAVWMTGPVQAKGEIEQILGVPSGLDLVAFIPVGYPAESPALKERRPVTEVSELIP